MGNQEGLDRSSVIQQTTSNKNDNAHAKYEDEFEGGWDIARSGVEAPKHDANVFGGGHGKASKLEDKSRGEAGYGNRLWTASTVAAAEHASEWGVIATPVSAYFDPCVDGIAEQQSSIEQNHASDSAFTRDPDWTAKAKKYSQAWAGENMQSMMRYQVEQSSQCTAFNAWIPIANASHAAMAEMVEAARLMGFDPSKDKDSVAFIEAIEASLDMATGLVDAKMLGAAGGTSWSNRSDDASVQSKAQPQLGGTEIGGEVQALGEAYRTLRDAYLEVYRSLVKDKKKIVDQEIADKQNKIDSINNTIKFWNGIASFSDGAIMNANTAIRLEHKVTTAIRSGQYKGASMRRAAEKQAKHAEDHPHDYESEIDAHAKADDFESHEDYWGHGAASVEANGPQAPEVPAPDELPSLSLSGLVSLGLQLWSQKALNELGAKLEALRGKQGATQATIDLTETMSAKAKYQTAGEAFETRIKTIGSHSLALRQQDFMDTGAQLDAYALEHQHSLSAQGEGNLTPGGGHEIYSTMMAVMGRVEQYRTLSKLARDTFDYEGCVRIARDQQLERAGVKRPAESASRDTSHAYNPPPPVCRMNERELQVYQQMTGSYLQVQQQDAHWSVRLAGVVPRFQHLMKQLAGHGTRGVGRRY